MYINQVSVFVENKKGTLAEITGILASANLSIRAFSISDTTDFGILRLIVNDPEKAKEVLQNAGIAVSMTKVIAIKMYDQPGSMHQIMAKLNDLDISVEYAYAFISHKKNDAYIIIRVEDVENVSKTISNNGITVVPESEVCAL